MEWKDLRNSVGQFAPLVGTILGGPAGGAIGSLVATALNVENNPEAIYKAIQTDPNVSVKLKELQIQNEAMLNEHIQKMASIELEYERTRVEERKSAHEREVNLVKAGASNQEQVILAFIGVGSFFFLVAHIVVNGLPQMDKETAFIVGSLIGSASMIAKDIYGYYFGSSKGSKDKTMHLATKDK